MIQIFAPCYLPFKLGTILHGSTGNTVLSDPMLGTIDFQGVKILLNKSIGDDLYIPTDGIHALIDMSKAYDLLDDILYEYSLFRITIPGADEPYYIPISVKRYDTSMPYTFLFPRGITLALDTLRTTRNYNIISATALMKMFSGTPVTFVDNMFSIELPRLMEDILSELGTYALHDPACSDIAMRTMFEELSKSYDQLIAYDQPRDLMSYYGCQENNYIPLGVIERNIDACVNRFYLPFAQEAQSKLQERQDHLVPLDYQQVVFRDFGIHAILDALYQAPYTDISMIVEQSGARDVHVQKLFGIQPIDYPDCASVWVKMTPDMAIATYLHDGLIHHNQRNQNKISMIVFCKTWMDDLHLDVYMENGECYNYYLNMALYHLYSTSIVRLHQQII